MKILLISVYFVIFQNLIFSQSNFELCVGGGSSNVLKYRNSEQVVEAVPSNSPNYLLTKHFGAHYNIKLGMNFRLKLGLNYFERGSSDYEWIVIPIDTFIDHEAAYLGMPIEIQYRLLSQKDFYFTIGVVPAKIVKNKINIEIGPDIFYEAFQFIKKYHLFYELGFRFPVYKNFHGQMLFSRSVNSFTKQPEDLPFERRNFHISYDLNLIYKF